VWALGSGQRLATLPGHRGRVNALAAWPDGRLLSASADRTLRVWDPGSGRCLAVVRGDAEPCAATITGPHRVAVGDAIGNVWLVALPGS
jgi:WD40 repeat protein